MQKSKYYGFTITCRQCNKNISSGQESRNRFKLFWPKARYPHLLCNITYQSFLAIFRSYLLLLPRFLPFRHHSRGDLAFHAPKLRKTGRRTSMTTCLVRYHFFIWWSRPINAHQPRGGWPAELSIDESPDPFGAGALISIDKRRAEKKGLAMRD